MAFDMADSQYLLILAPSLVIVLMFLFFWLFMKETSYDEVLARQKRDLKLPPVKADVRKKNDKKKNKKKETAETGGGRADDLEEDLGDFDAPDVSTLLENDDEPEVVPVAVAVVTPVLSESPAGVRERKKKEKKSKAAAVPSTATVSPPVIAKEPEINGSKPDVHKEQPLPHAKQSPSLTKQPSPVKPQTITAPVETTSKKKSKKQKIENDTTVAEPKPEQSPAVVKKEEPVLAIPKLQDEPVPVAVVPAPAPTTSTGSGRRRNKKQKAEAAITVNEPVLQSSPPVSRTDAAPSANHQSSKSDEAPGPASPPASISTKQSKKQKNETDKENSRVKLKELLASLGGLVLSDADVVSVVSLLRNKSPNALDTWYKTAVKFEPSAQQVAEKERLFTTLKEEASIAKDKVKQLSQELHAEKQKSTRAEAVLREQRAAMEKEVNVMQAKAQGSYQELQSMQIKFQKAREQLEGQIIKLQNENSIFRDAVSTTSSQMEQAAELEQLQSKCSGLLKDMSETKSKLQLEELQRKSLEANYKQNVTQMEVQLQDAKRRWEDLQNYLHSVNTEIDKLQAAKQDLQSQLLVVETEMSNKNKEIQNLQNSLTDIMVSKKQLEQKLMQMLEVSKHNLQPDNSLQAQVQDLMSDNKALQVQIETLQHQIASQANAVSNFEELQKLLAEKELQRKSLEDSLNAERSSGASRETNMQAIHNKNVALKAELQNMQAQVSEKASSQLAVDQLKHSLQEKDEKVKTVEVLLETSLIQVANKEEELKAVKVDNENLRLHINSLQHQTVEQNQSEVSRLEELRMQMQIKDEKIKSVEDGLKSALEKESSRVKVIDELKQQLETLTSELSQVKSRETQESSNSKAQLLDFQTQFATKDQEIQRLQNQIKEKTREAEQVMETSAQLLELQTLLASKDQELQTLQKEMEVRTMRAEEKLEKTRQQVESAVPSQEFLSTIALKDQQLSEVQAELLEMRENMELQRKKNNELREKNWCAMEALSATETMLQRKLNKTVKESHVALEGVEAECRAFLHRLLPHVPLPNDQNHKEWLQSFERSVMKAGGGAGHEENCASDGSKEEGLAEKLKKAEEAQKVLQKDCETYKKVLAETEGILQRLQSSVEQEESHWREKLEFAQAEIREMTLKMTTLEQEVDRLNADGELDALRRAKQHVEAELERAERESATYVSEVRELKDLLTELQSKLDGSYTEAVRQNEELNSLKTQLSETLGKLEMEESERRKVAGDLYKAQLALEQIQEEISKEAAQADLIENSSLTTDDLDHKEKTAARLNQTVRELQQLLQAINRQLTKEQERGNGNN